MKITIDGQAYEYDPARMLNTEAIALQKVTGMRMTEWTNALTAGDAFALTGLVWLLWKRNGRDVSFDEVEFDIGSLNIEDEPEPPEPEVPTAAVDEAATEA